MLAKVACDVALLAQTEVAEVREGGDPARGSSAMPHKRNPVAAVAVAAAPRGCQGWSPPSSAPWPRSTSGPPATGAEWEPQRDLLRLVGSAAAWSRELLDGLEVDPARMRANLDAAGDCAAEAAVGALAGAVGRARARDLVDQAARAGVASGRPLADTLETPRSPATWARPGWRPPSTPAVPGLGPGPDRPGPGRPRLTGRRSGTRVGRAREDGKTASTLARMLANRRTW